MKSIALIVWLLTAHGHQEIVLTDHYDDMATCEHQARTVTDDYARQGKKTRYLCHAVVEEVGGVDEYGNPIEAQ